MRISHSNTQEFAWQWEQFTKLILQSLGLKHCSIFQIVLAAWTKIQWKILRKTLGRRKICARTKYLLIKTNQSKSAQPLKVDGKCIWKSHEIYHGKASQPGWVGRLNFIYTTLKKVSQTNVNNVKEWATSFTSQQLATLLIPFDFLNVILASESHFLFEFQVVSKWGNHLKIKTFKVKIAIKSVITQDFQKLLGKLRWVRLSKVAWPGKLKHGLKLE